MGQRPDRIPERKVELPEGLRRQPDATVTRGFGYLEGGTNARDR
jgi:hypothetical protein